MTLPRWFILKMCVLVLFPVQALWAAAPADGCENSLLLVETPRSREMVESAVENLQRFRIDAASDTLRLLAQRADGGYAAHHLQSMAFFLVGLVTDREEHFERFDAHADTLEALLKRGPESCWSDYLRAETELQRGVVAVKQESYLRAAWHGRAAYKQYERAVKRNPTFAELYKGYGLMHAGLGALPGTWRRFLSILGYEGSILKGIEELDVAASRSYVNRDAAALSAGLARSILGVDNAGGLAQLREVHERHPDSPFFGYLYGFRLLENRQAEEAEEILRRYARQKGDGSHFYIDFVDYYLARSLFVQDRFDEAARYFSTYLSSHSGPSLMSSARLYLGLALEMSGKPEDARAHYAAVDVEREYDVDAVSKREALRRLEAPLAGHRRQLLLGANAYDSGRYETAMNLLRSVFSAEDAAREERVEAAFRIGRVHQATGRLEEAISAYGFVIEHARDSQAKWAPWAHLHIAEIHAVRGQNDEARERYEKALSIRGPYDYQQSLEQMARAALEVLRRDG